MYSLTSWSNKGEWWGNTREREMSRPVCSPWIVPHLAPVGSRVLGEEDHYSGPKGRSSVFIVGFSPCVSLIWRSYEQIVASLNYQKKARIWFFSESWICGPLPQMLIVSSPDLICLVSQSLHFTQWLGDSFDPLSSYLGSPCFCICPFSTDGSKDSSAFGRSYSYISAMGVWVSNG